MILVPSFSDLFAPSADLFAPSADLFAPSPTSLHLQQPLCTFTDLFALYSVCSFPQFMAYSIAILPALTSENAPFAFDPWSSLMTDTPPTHPPFHVSFALPTPLSFALSPVSVCPSFSPPPSLCHFVSLPLIPSLSLSISLSLSLSLSRSGSRQNHPHFHHQHSNCIFFPPYF